MDPHVLLAVAEGCGPGMVTALLDTDRPPEEILRDPPPLPAAAAARLGASAELRRRAEEWLIRARAAGCQVLTPNDPHYPERLRHAPLRPNVLFVQGGIDAIAEANIGLAIVGSRTPTPYGECAARDFAGAIARAGVVVWSGLAIGVDGLAHLEALAADSPTVAVLAGGLDAIYPASHADLAASIRTRGGALLTEAPPGQRARRGHFPRRNRILAAATRGVLVIEAGLRSGSIHTANFATHVGVPVFAVPGPYQGPRSIGCHHLISDGARIALSPEYLLRELGVALALDDPEASGHALDLSADEEAILRALRSGPRPIDLLQRETGLAEDRFLIAMFGLARKGRAHQGPGDLLHPSAKQAGGRGGRSSG